MTRASEFTARLRRLRSRWFLQRKMVPRKIAVNKFCSAHGKRPVVVKAAVRTSSFTISAIRLCALLVLSSACIGIANTAQAASRWATLEAIHRLENPRNLTRPGRYGELGAYQFRASTWQMHTKEPFHRALDRGVADRVAVKHYEWLKRGLERAGLQASPYNIALAWNGGLTAAIKGRAPRVAHAYAQRAENIAEVLSGRTSIVAAAD